MDAKQTFISGISWNAASQIYRQGWSFVILIILARLLSPKDFGLIGMTTVFIQFFSMFLTMGFESSIIQSTKLNIDELSSLFWLNILIGILLVIIAFIASPLISAFYDIGELATIFSVLSLMFIANSVSIVPRGLLTKNFEFKSLTIIESGSATISGILAVVIAILGGRYWSLIIQQISYSLLVSIGYIYHKKWKPRLHFNFTEIKHHLNFSVNVFFFNLLNFVSRRSDVLLIGKFLGAEQLGIYMMAYDFVMKPLGQAMGIFSKTMFPIFAEYKEETVKLKNIYSRITYNMFFLFAPILLFSAIISPIVLPKLLGDKWSPAVNIFQVVAVGALFTVIGSPVGNIFLAKGRPDLQWKFSLFFATPLYIVGLLAGYYLSNTALGVAIGFNLALGLVLIPGFLIAFPLIKLKLGEYFSELRILFFALFVMAISAMPLYLALNRIISNNIILMCFLAVLPILTYIYIINRYQKTQILFLKDESKNIFKKLVSNISNKSKVVD